MDSDKLKKIENILDTIDNNIEDIKILKNDKGLIERTTTSKIILTEDNRQVLMD